MTPKQLALGRHHSYRLLGRLYLDGLTAVIHPFIQQIPELSAVADPFNEDEAAAAHHHLFAFNVFPYEGLFLGSDGLLGGDVTQAVAQAYQRAGYVVDTAVSSPDHLGCQCDFLSFLAAAEADAWEDRLPQEANRLREMQRTFLQTHLLCWGVPCLLAIQEQGNPFFTQCATVTVNLLLAHHDELTETACTEPADVAVSSPHFLPAIPNILAEDKTGFKEIVRHLLTPAFSGFYLSREDIGKLARQLELPRGFGNREQMLMNLLRTAVQYDALPLLLSILEKTCCHWENSYQHLLDTYPQAVPFIHPWQERVTFTKNMVIELMSSSSISELD